LCLVDLADDRHALPSIRVVRAQHPQVPIGAIVDPSNPLVAGEALHLGAVDLLPWPFDGRDVTTLLANVADRQDAAPALEAARTCGVDALFAQSAPMRLVVDAVRRAADTAGGVCLCGEPGTGRARVAHAIHTQSGRAAQPFVVVDCAGISPEDLERRLFGAAIERRAQPRGQAVERIAPGGAIFEARGGTLYLANRR
jgi:DNA-binding NtrC family response regulator